VIEDYSFGRIVVDGREYGSDVIVGGGKVREGWWRREGHRLVVEDLLEALEMEPEVLVVGTGAYGRMRVPEETVDSLRARGIEVVVERTGVAWRTYNRLSGERRVVAALHLTC